MPESYFPSVGRLWSLFTERPRVQFWMHRDEKSPSTIHTRDLTTGPWFEMRPASLVHDAPMQAGMPRHLALMILGIVDEGLAVPAEKVVAEHFASANKLADKLDAARCLTIQNAALSLYPNSTFECDEGKLRRQKAKQNREARERQDAEAGVRKRAQAAEAAEAAEADAASGEKQTGKRALANPGIKDADWAYKILNITRGASAEGVKKAYKEAAKKHHPDKGGNEEDFKLLREAFGVINITSFNGTLFGVRHGAKRRR